VPPLRPPLFGRRWAALIALGGGLAGVLAFPRFGVWPMAFVSAGALSVAVDGRGARTAAWLGFLYGGGFMIPLLSWTGIYVGPVPWLILALAMAGWFALLGAMVPALARLPGGPAWVGAGWVLQETLRGALPFGGFPWGRLAFSQSESPLRWFAALGGAPLVTFAVATAAAALGVAVLGVCRPARPGPARLRAAAAGLAALVAVTVLGALLAWPLGPAPDRRGRTQTIALIQGGLPDLKLQFESRAEQVLDNHIRQTLKLAAEVKAGTVPRPDLVLWPENASDVDPFQNPAAYAKIDRAVKAVGAPVLVGAILQGPGPTHRRNVGILWSPRSGPGAEYVKRHPVPFAEYIPLRSVAEWVSKDAKSVTQDMVAGHGNGLLRGAKVPIGDVICFEVAYDDLVRSSVTAGAQLLVVQTNNATFGHTAETYQQLAMSRLRAVESGRTVVQVATTGKSAVIGPDGVVRAESGPLFAPAILDLSVPVRSVFTPATRLGPWPAYLLSALAIVGLGWQALRSRRTRAAAIPGGVTATEKETVTH
jgi:apolipoprotein N-acyltransferase